MTHRQNGYALPVVAIAHHLRTSAELNDPFADCRRQPLDGSPDFRMLAQCLYALANRLRRALARRCILGSEKLL